MRLVALDTETTGMKKRCDHGEVCKGHRIIEIACVEIIDGVVTGRHFHSFIKPDRKVDPKAKRIHGITDKLLKNKPSFKDVAPEVIRFIDGATLIIHNAEFDIAFLDQELKLLDEELQPIGKQYRFIDTLQLSRRLFPNQSNTLKALADRFGVHIQGALHSALTDAVTLAHVYMNLIN